MRHRPTIAVVDFGSQFSQLITRRLRELGAFSEMLPPHGAWDLPSREGLAGIILSGGPSSVVEIEAPGLATRDRGRHELKGVPGDWQLYAIESRG